jgi:hypothetical protein
MRSLHIISRWKRIVLIFSTVGLALWAFQVNEGVTLIGLAGETPISLRAPASGSLIIHLKTKRQWVERGAPMIEVIDPLLEAEIGRGLIEYSKARMTLIERTIQSVFEWEDHRRAWSAQEGQAVAQSASTSAQAGGERAELKALRRALPALKSAIKAGVMSGSALAEIEAEIERLKTRRRSLNVQAQALKGLKESLNSTALPPLFLSAISALRDPSERPHGDSSRPPLPPTSPPQGAPVLESLSLAFDLAITSAQALVEAQQNHLERLRARRSALTLKAPIAGYVSLGDLSSDVYVQSGEELGVLLAPIQKVRAWSISPAQHQEMRHGAQVRVWIPTDRAPSGEWVRGLVTSVDARMTALPPVLNTHREGALQFGRAISIDLDLGSHKVIDLVNTPIWVRVQR